MLKLDSRKVDCIPQKSDSNACRANGFAMAKSFPNVLDSSSALGQLINMVAGRDIQSIEERRSLSFEVVVGFDLLLRIMVMPRGKDFPTAWTDNEDHGLRAGESITHSFDFVEIETVRNKDSDAP
jgi:hypothetical protein